MSVHAHQLTVHSTGVQQVCPQYKREVRQCILTVQDPKTGGMWGRMVEVWGCVVEVWGCVVEVWGHVVEVWRHVVEVWGCVMEVWGRVVEVWKCVVEVHVGTCD